VSFILLYSDLKIRNRTLNISNASIYGLMLIETGENIQAMDKTDIKKMERI